MPVVVSRVLEIANNPETTAVELCEIVVQDVAVSDTGAIRFR